MEQVKVIEKTKNSLQIALCGDIDLGNADAFYNEVVTAYNENKANIVFDCNGLNFIDSTTLGTFVKILKLVKLNGHTMKLINLQSQIKKLFLICSLNKIMELE